MKTTAEIKKGLECCAVCSTPSCQVCGYAENGMTCVSQLVSDALAYIQQLEEDNAQQARCIENLTDKLNATNDALPRWISVGSEEKPMHCKEYLCLCTLPNDPMHEWDYIAVLRWNGHGGNGYVNGPHFQHEGLEGMKVTHWMPLPDHPKDEMEE